MRDDFYSYIGIAVVWSVKYILLPFGVAFSAKIAAGKLLQPQPKRQRKKRSNKNRFK